MIARTQDCPFVTAFEAKADQSGGHVHHFRAHDHLPLRRMLGPAREAKRSAVAAFAFAEVWPERLFTRQFDETGHESQAECAGAEIAQMPWRMCGDPVQGADRSNADAKFGAHLFH